MSLAFSIFVGTLSLVIWQPRRLGIGWLALAGAGLALAVGVVRWQDIPVVWSIVWNATSTLIALVIISVLLDEAGFFEWAALHVARWGNGRGRLLFAYLILLGAAVSAVLTNDGTALILTPIVLEMLRALGFGPAPSLAFLMAIGFVADATSLPFVVSNLVNIVSADFFGLSFADYARVMVPVNLTALAATLVVLLARFGRDIPHSYRLAALRSPGEAIRDPATFRWGWLVLAIVLVGYFAAEPLGIPVSAVAGFGALLLLAVAGRFGDRNGSRPVIPVGRVVRSAPWQVVLFSLGMYLVVYGLRNAGLTTALARALEWLAGRGLVAATVGTGLLAALLSAVMNNLPTVLAGALAIDAVTGVTPAVRQAMIYANVVGSDLGPKITPIGSLATLLWLHVLARKGVRVGWAEYFAIGVVLTIPVLSLTLLALAGWLAALR